MSAGWVVQALLVALLLSAAAVAADRAAAWLGYARRAVWGVALFGSAALAWLSLLAPGAIPDLGLLPDRPAALAGFDLAGSGTLAASPAEALAEAGGAEAETFQLSTVLIVTWLSTTAALLAVIGWTYWRLRSLRRASMRRYLDGVPVRVVDAAGPAVVGLLRPEILLPRWVVDLPREERNLILMHEREHLAGRDSWLLFASTVTVALLPWCAFLWWQHHRLRRSIETDCDARVLARGADLRTYGRILIRTASSTPGLPLLNPAWGESSSQLERRIMTMTTNRPDHSVLRSIPMVALALGIFATACDVASRSDPQPAPELVTYNAPAGVDTVVVAGSASATAGGDHGISGMNWPEGGGPSFAGGTPRPPTTHAVLRVRQGGSAWHAGLRDGDVLLEVNGRDTRTLLYPFADRTVGTRYSVRVRRGAEELEFTLEVAPRDFRGVG